MYSYRPPRKRSKPTGGRALQGYVLPGEGEERHLRRVRWRRVLVALAMLAVIAGVIALYKSPLLRVQEVEVVGANNVDPQVVRGLAALEGRSMFNPPLDDAEERISAALPLIKTVKAERRWPQSVRIEVTERTPWGYWQVDNRAYVVDNEGVVLEGVKPPEGAPTIHQRDSQGGLIAGDVVDPASIQLAARLLTAVPELLGLEVERFEYDEASGLTAVTSADYRVVMGDAQNYEYKLAVWQALEGRLGREAMVGQVLDLRFGDRPSFRGKEVLR